MQKILAVLLCCAFLAGCSSEELPPAQFVAPPVNKIVLNVASIDVIDHSDFQPSNSPYNTYHLQPTIAQVVRKWAKDTLQAGGTSGQATILIQDASLSAQALPTNNGLMDKWFKRQQASKYSGHVSVQLDIRSAKNYGFAAAEANQFITLPEEPTAAERQNAYVELLNGLFSDFRRNFDTSLHEHVHWAVMP